MGLPNEHSIFCKGKCGMFNIDEPYCEDCAKEVLLEEGFSKKTVEKIIKSLFY